MNTYIQEYAYTHVDIIHMFKHTISLPNRGDSQVVQKGGVSACPWMDRKVVMVMFCNVHPSATVSVLRLQNDHTHTPIICPEADHLHG